MDDSFNRAYYGDPYMIGRGLPATKAPTTEEGRWWDVLEPKYAAAGTFIVFNPAGRAPTHRHKTPDAAEAEAKRLAKLHPGQEFYVMGAMSKTSVPKPVDPTTVRLV